MKCCPLFAVVGIAAIAGSIGFAQPAKDTKKPQPTAAQPELPPGMSEADMKACEEAATPGPMHAFLAKGAGVWQGKTKMWMAPEAPVQESECTSTISTIMDGRFVKCELTGDMMGMPFNGFGINGFDNVSQKFQSTWIDNCGTGIMVGTGELSPDQKTMTWKYAYNCPVTKKQTTMREIERYTGKDSMTLEIFGIEPHSGKEFKMMEIAFTRNPATPAGGSVR